MPEALNKQQIAALIPHAGAMCLLDRVDRWDSTSIRCASAHHEDEKNPLRTGAALPALRAIEYAAQAMAIHGALNGTTSARPLAGYLVSLRDVICRRATLDGLSGELIVDAEQLIAEADRVIYRFSAAVGETGFLEGRATVILDAGGR